MSAILRPTRKVLRNCHRIKGFRFHVKDLQLLGFSFSDYHFPPEPQDSNMMILGNKNPGEYFIIITWTPKVCKIMAFVAISLGLGLLFYILLVFR